MKKVLVIVDMQNDFIDGSLGTKEAQAIVDNVVNKIKHWDGDIIVTRDTHDENYLNTREGKYLPVKHCIKDTDGWQLNNKVLNALLHYNTGKLNIIDKPTFGTFLLKEYIYHGNYEYIEFCGLCTDICVVSNALIIKNAFSEREVVVDSTCCAGVTPESHNAALLTMKMCQINII